MSDPLIVAPTAKHTASIIFSHGLGDTGRGWLSFAQVLASQYPHVKWILPTAPVRPISINAGREMTSWFDARSFGRPHLDGGAHEDEAGMLAAVATIGQLVAGEVDDGIPSERIVVGGFSQGSVISLLTGLTNERRLAGLVCLSGWLGLSGKAAELQTAHAKELAIFWGHGTSDPVVPYTRAQESVELLQGLGFGQVELHTYSGMPHSLCAQEQQDVAEFIAKVLPPVAA